MLVFFMIQSEAQARALADQGVQAARDAQVCIVLYICMKLSHVASPIYLILFCYCLTAQDAQWRTGAAAREAMRQNAAWEAASLLRRRQEDQQEASAAADLAAERAMDHDQV